LPSSGFFNASRSNRPSSDTIYQGIVIVPYVKDISEKFRRIGNRFNLRDIFKTKPTFRGILIKTRPVRDVLQTKRCACSKSPVIVAHDTSAKQADL
jgi:hypothetical protein